MRLLPVVLACLICSPAAEIPKGTHTLLRVINSISTRTAREGDFVYFRTATPIVVNNSVIVPPESYMQGVVTRSVRGGRVKGTAELAIRIETLTLPSGKVLKLTPKFASIDSGGTGQKVVGTESEVKQGTSVGSDAVRITSISGVGAAIGGITDRGWQGAGIGAGAGSAAGLAMVMLTRGREVEMLQGSTVDVVFDRVVSLN